MSHKNLNPVNAARPKRVAIVLANPGTASSTGWPVGFWWAELSHPYFHFTEAGYQVELFSPEGGRCVPDALSDPEDASGWQAEDVISRGYKHDPAFMALLEDTAPIAGFDADRFDAMVVAGGQSPMFTFEKAEALHQAFARFYETGKVTAALCHGAAILRYARLSDGEMPVAGKTVTGFANVEEDASDQALWEFGALPKGEHFMPWRIQDELTKLGANYVQAGLWRGFAVRDGNLITGQQNFSGGETAQLILEALGR